MKDPQWPLIQAVYAALKGLTLPVHSALPLNVDEYVLISQPTLNESRLSAACTAWEATLLLSVYTKFKQKGQVSVQPTLAVSNEVMGRLSGTTLSFDEFSTSPLRFQRINLSQRAEAGVVYVQDAMRVRFTAYAHLATAPAPVPTPIQYGLTLNDANPEGGSVSFASPNGSGISFNEVPDAAGPPFDAVFIQNGVSSFATLTDEYLNKPFAFFDAKGTRYDRDRNGRSLIFIDGPIYLDSVEITPPEPAPAPIKYGLTLSNDNPEGGSVSFASNDGSGISFNEIVEAADSPFDTIFIHNGVSSFATLTGEYLNKPFAFFDALGKRYERDLAGKPLAFIDGAISI